MNVRQRTAWLPAAVLLAWLTLHARGGVRAEDLMFEPLAADTPAAKPAESGKLDDLLKLDLDQLSNVRVGSGAQNANVTAPSNQLMSGKTDFNEATSTGELLKDIPSMSARRTSAINLDPRVRGYNSSQLNASANGMTQLKTRLDIDSVFSQIDPGIVQDISVTDGPYTSLYGPGYAFLVADLLPTPRYAAGPEIHFSTYFNYGSNGQTLYSRDNVYTGGKDWGAVVSYGLRVGNDYSPGGWGDSYRIPSSYQKWDGYMAVGYDLNRYSRIEFNYLRTDMNDVELPGVVYDVDNSKNDQFNVRYIIQSDRDGPEDLVLQTWFTNTAYHGDASSPSKQQSLYYSFFTFSNPDQPVNTFGQGTTESLGVRALRTFGDANAPQWTIGADWRRYRQRYAEEDVNAAGQLVFEGDIFGIPQSQMDDVGCLTNLWVPLSDAFSMSIGGRVDWCQATFNKNDPVVTEFAGPIQDFYFNPGYEEPGRALAMGYGTGKYKLSEEYTLSMGTGYAMRMPDLAELYSDDPYTPLARFGNSYVSGLSNLRPEQNWQVDLGLTFEKKRLSYGVRGFYSTIHDYIMPVPAYIDTTPTLPAPKVLGRDFSYFPPSQRTDLGTINENCDLCQAGYQYTNIDLATLFGGDLFAEVGLLDWLSVYGSMAYVRGTNWTPEVFVHDPYNPVPATAGTFVRIPGHTESLPGIYPFNGTLAVRLFDPDRKKDLWGFEFASRMVYRHDYLATSLSEIGTPGFAVFDLHSYYRVRQNVRVTLAVRNLLDRYYVEPGSLAVIGPDGLPTFLAEPGVSAIVGVDARF